MSTALLVVAVSAFLLVAVGIGWMAHLRVKALREQAGRLGWTYVRRDKTQTRRDGTPFGTGRARTAEHVLTGQVGGRPFTTFDYRFTTGDPKHSQTHRYVITVVHLPSVLPRLQVCEANLITRLAGLVGMGDIALESDRFNRRFRVTSDDRRFAYGVLTPLTMERMLGERSVMLRVHGAEVLSWASGRLRAEDVEARVQQLVEFADAVPDHVWSDSSTGGTS